MTTRDERGRQAPADDWRAVSRRDGRLTEDDLAVIQRTTDSGTMDHA